MLRLAFPTVVDMDLMAQLGEDASDNVHNKLLTGFKVSAAKQDLLCGFFPLVVWTTNGSAVHHCVGDFLCYRTARAMCWLCYLVWSV